MYIQKVSHKRKQNNKNNQSFIHINKNTNKKKTINSRKVINIQRICSKKVQIFLRKYQKHLKTVNNPMKQQLNGRE